LKAPTRNYLMVLRDRAVPRLRRDRGELG